ncbi:TerB family tellurite resistance protein [Pseudorhodobacter sp. E13]|uniref:tellurite resistance TerB family protein n=1 Tax=Pseudorhodobacter sp. E13 TaxID=2487931 RepID=UPI000F8D4704|nr:TerB family tellurite resistance protein [Pseudorhodobacter sp. E13]RUS60730.1 TerB family tellurite resistance protein [Pseudorhodobacter sp. E13]
MFERILSLFSATAGYRTPLPEADAKHALGAILVRAAQADKAYLFQEVERIDRILAKRFNLNPLEAAKMRAQCERLSDEMPDNTALITVLHDAVDLPEREATLRALWQVVFADGYAHETEDEFVTQVQQMFGVSPEVCARLRAEVLADLQKR